MKQIQAIANRLYFAISIVFVWMLMHYSLFMWETRQRYGIIFLALVLVLASLKLIVSSSLPGSKKSIDISLYALFIIVACTCGIYFWTEYDSLMWERTGALNTADVMFSTTMIYLVIHLTWKTSGAVIPWVTLFFIAYALWGDRIPGFFGHSPISFRRFVEFSAGEMDGIFGSLNQLGATYIAIFAFYAGFIQGFGGLDYILGLSYKLVGNRKTSMPQVAVISSMIFGCMSGSAAANAAATGAFTIPTMKRFGLPPAMAAAVEAVASSGGQIMPPILGAVAFVMSDYLNMYYYQILLASLFGSFIFFGSTMVSTQFLGQRYIDAKAEVEIPNHLKQMLDKKFLLQGIPMAISMGVMLFVFIVYQINILLGGFFAIIAFLIARLIYEIWATRGRLVFFTNFIKGVYRGSVEGASNMIALGAMLAALGIIVRVFGTTGLGEKISFTMVSAFGDTLWIFLILTMCVCILFGMAVTTVGAYIMVVTLAAPALVKLGISPLVAHFAVFYWGMLSAITPPVAGACVITSGIAKADYMKTCWESMKLGFPKFILPFYFIAYPAILSFSLNGFLEFFFASVGFVALSAGIQSGWGKLPQAVMLILGIVVIIVPQSIILWLLSFLTVTVLILFWRRYNNRVKPFIRPGRLYPNKALEHA